MQPIPDTLAAYFAGLIDGEGCITILQGQNGAGRKHYKAIVVVTNKARKPLEMMVEAFGGNVYSQRNGTVHHFRLENHNVGDCLRTVLPYLVIKRERAEAVLEFVGYTVRHGGRWFKYPPEVEARRMELVKWVSELTAQLNEKGVKRLNALRNPA